jgi:hypothetical protein
MAKPFSQMTAQELFEKGLAYQKTDEFKQKLAELAELNRDFDSSTIDENETPDPNEEDPELLAALAEAQDPDNCIPFEVVEEEMRLWREHYKRLDELNKKSA